MWFVVAILVRVACLVLLTPAVPLLGDSIQYVVFGRALLEDADLLTAGAEEVRPPLYFALVALGLDRGEQPPDPFPFVHLMQIAADLAAGWLVVRLTRRRFGGRAAQAAGWTFALLPTSILYASAVVMAEALAGFGVALALYALDRLEAAIERGESARSNVPRALLLGLALGLAVQWKELALLAAGAVLAALALEGRVARRGRALLAGAVLGVVLLTLVPFTLFTWKRVGIPLPTGTYGYLSLVYDNAPPGTFGFAAWKAKSSVLERIELARDTFVAAWTEYPATTVRRALTRLRVLLGPELYLPSMLEAAASGPPRIPSSTSAYYAETWRLPRGSTGGLVQLAMDGATWLVLALGLGGLLAARPSLLRRSLLVLALTTLVVVAATVAMERYRHLLTPGLLPFAGYAIATLWRDPTEAADAREKGRVRAAVLAVALVLLSTMFLLPPPPIE